MIASARQPQHTRHRQRARSAEHVTNRPQNPPGKFSLTIRCRAAQRAQRKSIVIIMHRDDAPSVVRSVYPIARHRQNPQRHRQSPRQCDLKLTAHNHRRFPPTARHATIASAGNANSAIGLAKNATPNTTLAHTHHRRCANSNPSSTKINPTGSKCPFPPISITGNGCHAYSTAHHTLRPCSINASDQQPDRDDIRDHMHPPIRQQRRRSG